MNQTNKTKAEHEHGKPELRTILRMLGAFRLSPGKVDDPELTPKNYRVNMLEGVETALVEAHGVFWLVHYNGGEWNVEHVNGGNCRSVPATSFGEWLNPATAAQRIAAVIRGEEIDFSNPMTDFENRLLLESLGEA